MPRPKGLPKTGGRQAGTGNKFSAALKDVILQSLHEVGGVEYLNAQAKANPTAYMSLIGRVLPLQIKDGGQEPQMPKIVQHLHPDAKG